MDVSTFNPCITFPTHHERCFSHSEKHYSETLTAFMLENNLNHTCVHLLLLNDFRLGGNRATCCWTSWFIVYYGCALIADVSCIKYIPPDSHPFLRCKCSFLVSFPRTRCSIPIQVEFSASCVVWYGIPNPTSASSFGRLSCRQNTHISIHGLFRHTEEIKQTWPALCHLIPTHHRLNQTKMW